jgi:hypothetical protein
LEPAPFLAYSVLRLTEPIVGKGGIAPYAQKRNDDTVLILAEPPEPSDDSEGGGAARRIVNRLHGL